MAALLGAVASLAAATAPVVIDTGLTDRTVSQRTNIGPATYTVANDGTVKNGSGTTLETWTELSPALFEVRATLVDGTVPVGTMDTWQSCSFSRSWSNSSGGNQTSEILVEIRLASSGVVQDSALIVIISRDPL